MCYNPAVVHVQSKHQIREDVLSKAPVGKATAADVLLTTEVEELVTPL